MERKVRNQIRGYRTKDGAGVSLVRVLGNQTVEELKNVLMGGQIMLKTVTKAPTFRCRIRMD